MKKLISTILALLLAAAVLCPGALAKDESEPKLVSGETLIDTDGSDGYSGDYVVIYNPATSTGGGVSTGNMTGLIETEIEPSVLPASVSDEARPYRIDVDGKLAEKAMAAGVEMPDERENAAVSYEVGDTRNFIIMNYSPDGYSMEFKVLAKGEHCYIWTPTSTASNVWPLDAIDPSYAEICMNEFDSKYELMHEYFGSHNNGSQGDGRLSLLYYNIDDGWQPGQGYIGGYFYALDLYINGLPCLNIDTYPGVHYVTANGEEHNDVTGTYNTMVHEYQHLINYSECGTADTWINECFSAGAEELCYPGSSVCSRIQSWINHRYTDDWADPPAETEYVPEFTVENGFSMYDWNNDLEIDDILVLYAQVSLFAQYMYSHYGNGIFRSLMTQLASGSNFQTGFQAATGENTADFVGNFRAALTANTTQEEYDGRYGFIMQPGYDPANYHGVQNLYDLLCPVVFTGSSCSIKGGGAICVKPVGGVYNPPSGAGASLRYFGITRSEIEQEPVSIISVDIDIHEITLSVGETVDLTAIINPANASDYDLIWQSTEPDIADVAGSGLHAVATAVSPGQAYIFFGAHDNTYDNDMIFTASCVVTVVENGDYLPGDVDMNGVVEVTDAVLAMRNAMDLIDLQPIQITIGDMDCSGAIEISDALRIMRIAMGIA